MSRPMISLVSHPISLVYLAQYLACISPSRGIDHVTLAPFGKHANVCYADEGHTTCTVLISKLTLSYTKLASKSHDVTKLPFERVTASDAPLSPLVQATVVMGGPHAVGDVFGGSSDAVPCAVSAANDDTAVVTEEGLEPSALLCLLYPPYARLEVPHRAGTCIFLSFPCDTFNLLSIEPLKYVLRVYRPSRVG